MCRVGLLLSVAFAAALAVQDVIIVADAGIDDAAGLLLAIASPSLNVLGIAATFGCHKDVEVTARNAERLLAAANRSHIPVFRGATNPYGSTEGLARDGSFVHGSDGMGDLTGQYGQECAPAEHHGVSASEFIAQSARKKPGEIALLSFSPLTNVALALAIEPRLPQLLKTVVAMGAAVRVANDAQFVTQGNSREDMRRFTDAGNIAETLVKRAVKKAEDRGCFAEGRRCDEPMYNSAAVEAKAAFGN